MSVESVDVRHFTVPNPGFEDSEDVVKEEDTSDSSISVSTPSLRRPKPSYVSQEWAAYSARLHYERDRSRNRWVHPEWEERSLLRQKLLLKTRRLKGGKVNSTSVLDEFTDPPFPDQAKSRRMFPALFARHAFTEEEASEYALAIGKARLVTYHSRWGEYDIKFVSQLIDIAIYNKIASFSAAMSTPSVLKNSQHRVRLAAMKLLAQLRKCHHEPPDETFYDRLLRDGKPADLLRIYHFLFLTMSPQITLHIHRKYEEFGAYKSDLQFMQIIYKFMREVLGTNPCVTLQQLFSNGFLLKKLEMTAQVAEGLLKLDKQLGGNLQQSIMRPSKGVNENVASQEEECLGTDCIEDPLPIEDARSPPVPSGLPVDADCLVKSMERLLVAVNSVDHKLDTLAEQVESRVGQLDARLRALELRLDSTPMKDMAVVSETGKESQETTMDEVDSPKEVLSDYDAVDEIIGRLDKHYEATQQMLEKSRALQMCSNVPSPS
ncbi:Transcription factor iws1 [Perkinsus olseni]|uniref:Centrosomal protein of 44 kDa n=2 Tax=Perkinsus olseni TaxID=32597 RepID=A0A7J6S0V2_PEROL|nr:Transcription factor iws1 [Perkinsus olseni]